jgi:hypothetical protein
MLGLFVSLNPNLCSAEPGHLLPRIRIVFESSCTNRSWSVSLWRIARKGVYLDESIRIENNALVIATR